MPKFHADNGFHFSEDGTPATTWAHFVLVPGSTPPVYEYETRKKAETDRLRKVDGITEVDDKPSDTKETRGKGTGTTPPDDTGAAATDGAGAGDGEDPAGA